MTKLISTNPSRNYEVLGEVNISSEKEIQDKVKLARSAQKNWGPIGISRRVKLLKTLVLAFAEKKEKLALLISQEMGMPFSQAIEDLNSGIRYFSWYLDNAETYLKPEITHEDDNEIHKVVYEPVGVVAVIVPWNFPFSNFVWQAGQNLTAGNAVVFKHSEETPLFGREIEKVFDLSEIPRGVFNEVYGGGEVGNLLVHQDIDMICFTGSSKIGKQLYRIGAEKFIPVLMELGGSAPGIVFEDSDIDKVIESIYINKFLNCGQVCDGLKRLIVHESKFQEVVKKLTAVIQGKRVGPAEDKNTEIGPLVAKRQLELLQEQVKDAVTKGAKIISGGKPPGNLKGAYYEPSLIVNVNRNMRIWQEEVFGPVLPVVSFKTYEEAIELANDTKYGLGGYVFTEDKKLFQRASSGIRTGMVAHNNVTYLMPCNPFGGCKDSGIGREHGKYGFREVCKTKTVSMEK
ncbi:MAG: aldehyde dehydrogenase [Candidatus Aenigmarchaeota archaeon]|nr:aldehyde dehydrogenase [Candidatus Aenigmarchaeota archaeon]